MISIWRLRISLNELGAILRALMREYPRTARTVIITLYVCAAVGIGVAALVLLWPAPPARTLSMYVTSLHRGRCRQAYALVSDDSKKRDARIGSLEDFQREICEPMESMYGRLYVDTRESPARARILGNSAEVEYCLCSLPAGMPRRVCSVHKATLAKQGYSWKIRFLEIGPWDKPCDFPSHKIEELVPPDSSFDRK